MSDALEKFLADSVLWKNLERDVTRPSDLPYGWVNLIKNTAEDMNVDLFDVFAIGCLDDNATLLPVFCLEGGAYFCETPAPVVYQDRHTFMMQNGQIAVVMRYPKKEQLEKLFPEDPYIDSDTRAYEWLWSQIATSWRAKYFDKQKFIESATSPETIAERFNLWYND